VTPGDLFHTGIVVDDFEATLERLTETFGYRWCPEISHPVPVRFADGAERELQFSFAYSADEPRLEIVRPIADTLWQPAAGSGIHHLGYWSADVVADSDALTRAGFELEVTGLRPDDQPFWSYLRHPAGHRVELVGAEVREGMELYWASAAD